MKKAILLILLLPMLASAQYFDVFDIDTSDYPIMKAKFYSIDANGKQILNHTPADFEITENGEPRDVISVSCPEPKVEPVSIVIALDVSGSMAGRELSNAKIAIKAFIDLVPNDGTEIAIIAFNGGNYYISDFTSNKEKLKSKVGTPNAGGVTSFDAAFTDPIAGAILAMEKAKHTNKNIILVTDGHATGNEGEIINKAINQNSSIFSIITENMDSDILNNISYSTGGKTFKNIISQNDFLEVFTNIYSELLNESCQILWSSDGACKQVIDLEIINVLNEKSYYGKFILDKIHLAQLTIDLYSINFGFINEGETKDTIISLKSNNRKLTIQNITFDPDYNFFKVLNTFPIIIEKADSANLVIEYYANDTLRQYSKLIITTQYCTSQIGLLAGSLYNTLENKTLILTHPNGNEIFFAGSDTNITWKGITENEKVKLNFSPDNGNSWSLISDSAINLRTNWTVPRIQSDSCLISIDQYSDKKSSYIEDGEIEWSKTFGGSSVETAIKVIQTKDGGYLTTGETFSNDGDFEIYGNYGQIDIFVLKYFFNGDLEWSKTLGGSNHDNVRDILEMSNGNYLVVGSSNSTDIDLKNVSTKGGYDSWLMKLDDTGEIVWTKTFGGTSSDAFNSSISTLDGGYIFVGYSYSDDENLKENGNKGLADAWVLKMDNLGDIEWTKTFGGSNLDYAYCIQQTSDEGYIISGTSKSSDGDFSTLGNKGEEDVWVLKLNNVGGTEWFKTYGGKKLDRLSSIIQTDEGGYILAGETMSFDDDLENAGYKGSQDAWVLKMDNLGNIEWTRTYGGSNEDQLNAIVQSKNGGYIIGGETRSYDGDLENIGNSNPDALLIKISDLGEIEWTKTYGGSDGELIFDMKETLDGGYIFVGNSSSDDEDLELEGNKGREDIWVVKIAGNITPLQSDTSDAVFSIIMPEPVIQNIDIDMGQMIVSSTKDTIVSSVICNIGDAPLHVLGVDITGGDAGDFLIPRGAGDFYLNKDECQDMMFEFAPSALGNRTAVATIRTTIGDFKDTIHIRGVGIAPVIEATSEVVDFGVFELGNGKDTTVVLVKNVGSTDITITDTRISGPDMEQFTLNLAPTNFTIVAGEEKEFRLNYTAKFGGKSNSFLDFHYDGIGSPIRSLLFAEGIGGEVYPVVADAYVGETVNLNLFLGKIKPEGLKEVATNFSATVSYNSTLLAPIDKSMLVTSENNKSFITITGELSSVSQIAAVPMKVGLGTDDRSGLVITEFQLYDANGDSVDYDIEPGVGEFNVLGICEEGGTRLINPNSEAVDMQVIPESNSGNALIHLTLIETGQTELEIYDQIGNKVETVYSGTPSTGQQEINLNLSKYANGRYYIKLTTPTITKTEIIEVVR